MPRLIRMQVWLPDLFEASAGGPVQRRGEGQIIVLICHFSWHLSGRTRQETLLRCQGRRILRLPAELQTPSHMSLAAGGWLGIVVILKKLNLCRLFLKIKHLYCPACSRAPAQCYVPQIILGRTPSQLAYLP